MGTNDSPLTFAIIGHPNEGKSSVVSTLSEDDSVVVSPTPGETTACQSLPVVIDGQEIIRFVDTPGFQNPSKTLKWMLAYSGLADELVKTFIAQFKKNADFTDEVELLTPLSAGAAIIYVVDGSRPMRKSDRLEMEILRLTARPRLAILNCKQTMTEYLDEWKGELRKNFNAIRVFNAHRATYAERISLLENLRNIEQEWEPSLTKVIQAFKKDWAQRNLRACEFIAQFLIDAIQHKKTEKYKKKENASQAKERLLSQYKTNIAQMEKKQHKTVKKLYHHNIFHMDLPDQALDEEDIFTTKTWQLIGLNPKQLATALSVGGGAVGAILDIAAAGLTFGIFTTLGGILGAGSVFWAGERLIQFKIKGLTLGGYQLEIGPNKNLAYFYTLLDRSLTYYTYVINWAHGRRDYEQLKEEQNNVAHRLKKGPIKWSKDQKEICQIFFKSIIDKEKNLDQFSRSRFIRMLMDIMEDLSMTEYIG